MLNTIQTQILQATIQNRNDNESVSRDMFEVSKKIAMDFAAYIENDDWIATEERFDEFVEQYNP